MCGNKKGEFAVRCWKLKDQGSTFFSITKNGIHVAKIVRDDEKDIP